MGPGRALFGASQGPYMGPPGRAPLGGLLGGWVRLSGDMAHIALQKGLRIGPIWGLPGPSWEPNMGWPRGHLNVRECIFPNMGLPREAPGTPYLGPPFGALLARTGPAQGPFERTRVYIPPQGCSGPAQKGPQIGPPRAPIWGPFYKGSRGLNHIDARLGGHCNYGILGSQEGPK